MKARILSGRVLRGSHPEAVTQKMWALLTYCQVSRTAMSDAVLAHPDIDPDRLSFNIGLRDVRDLLIQAKGIMTETTFDLVGHIGAAILAEPLPTRRIRTAPRIIKRTIYKYRAKKRHPDRRTYPSTLTMVIFTKPFRT